MKLADIKVWTFGHGPKTPAWLQAPVNPAAAANASPQPPGSGRAGDIDRDPADDHPVVPES